MSRPARVEQSNPAQEAMTRVIDERRAKDGEESSGQEQARISESMRAATAQIGTKSQGSSLALPTKRVLSLDRFESARSKTREWDVIVPHGTALEDLLDPRFWMNVGPQLAQWDHLECRWEDGSRYVELIVEDRGNRYAKVAVLVDLQLQVADPEGPSLPQGYEVEYKGPHTQWVVIRDGYPLRDKFSNRGAAMAWLGDHLRVMR